jgi:hypothetical protein
MANTRRAPDVLISADSHVGETTALRDRLSEAFRDRMQLFVPSPDHGFTVFMGETSVERPRHRPEETVLHTVVREQLETFLARAREGDRPAPCFVEREVRAYPRCGIPWVAGVLDHDGLASRTAGWRG